MDIAIPIALQVQANLPKNTFLSKIARFINPADLVFDLTIIAYTILLRKYVLGDSSLRDNLSTGWLMVVYNACYVFLPWYMGISYARISYFYKPFMRKLAFGVLSLIFLALFIFLIYNSFQSIDDTEGLAAFLTPVVFLILGPIMGGFSYSNESAILRAETPPDESGEIPSSFIVIAIGLSVLLMFYGAGYFMGDKHYNGFVEFLIIMGLMFGAAFSVVIAMAVVMLLKRGLQLIGIWKNIRYFIYFGLPFMCATLLFVVFDMSEHLAASFAGAVGDCGTRCELLIMTVTGILPFRILLFITPPIRPLSLLLGFIALYLASLSF